MTLSPTSNAARLLTVLVAAVALLAAFAPAAMADHEPPDVTQRLRTSYEQAAEDAMLTELNDFRAAELGSGAQMTAWTDLRAISRNWSQTMATTDVCHTSRVCSPGDDDTYIPNRWEADCTDLALAGVAWSRDSGQIGSFHPDDPAHVVAERLADRFTTSDTSEPSEWLTDARFDEFAVGVHVQAVPDNPDRYNTYVTVLLRERDTGCQPTGADGSDAVAYFGPGSTPDADNDPHYDPPEPEPEPDMPSDPRPEPTEPTESRPARIAGADRIDTAVQLSSTFDDADTVVLASATNYPDALAAAPYAGLHGAPLLLTDPTTLDSRVASELERLNPTTVLLMGGTGAMTTTVEQQAAAVLPDATITRAAGPDRFATAATIAEQVAANPSWDGTVLLVEGANSNRDRGWPDALAASAYAARSGTPILLTTTNQLPDATSRTLTTLSPDRIVAVGGTVAVSADTLTVAGHAADAPTVRWAGASRYATSALVDIATNLPANTVLLATGRNWADALAAGPAAAEHDAVLLLIDGTDPAGATTTVDHLNSWRPNADLTIVGGTAAITDQVATLLPSR